MFHKMQIPVGRRSWLVWLLLAAWQLPAQAACLGDPRAKPAWVFHVVPQYTAAQVYAQWTPLLEQIGRTAGLCFDLRVAPSIPEFEQVLFRGQADFAFLNPYHVVLAQPKQGYVPLVAGGKSRLTGILVIRADSPISTFKQLDGKEVAFPSPNAFAASLLPRAWLEQEKIHITPHFVNTHSNVYRAVINGDVQAGGAVNNTLAQEPRAVQEKLRILHTTPGFVSHPVAAHPRVPAKHREAFTNALLQLETQAAGQALLEKVQMSKPITVTYQRDYAPLESLNLGRFVSGSP